MNAHDSNNTAYILFLIRERIANTWEELCVHFGWPPAPPHTGHYELWESLDALRNAKLITIDGEYASFSVTTLLGKIQNALNISIDQLGNTHPANRLVVAPYFGKPYPTKPVYDIFVIMPFKEDMRAVYQDHLRNVASKLGMSIARADDFFTTHKLMEEIWRAIYSSRIVIADCTGKNPNVFYEMGVAHTIGKPVILITQNNDDVPSDLRHIRYVKYEFTPRGMKTFEKQLQQTISITDDELEDA